MITKNPEWSAEVLKGHFFAFCSEISLLTKNLVGDVIDLGSVPTHTVQIHAKADDPLVRGATTVIVSYLSPDQGKVLVSFWQV